MRMAADHHNNSRVFLCYYSAKVMKNFLHIILVVVISAELAGCFYVAAGAEGGYIAAQDDRTTSEVMKDQLLFTEVKTELAGAHGVSSTNIEVIVRKQVVTLKGVLSSDDEIKRAIKAARQAKDVKKVISKLLVVK
jgi:osmotically-inducible protein OsmY